MNSQPRVLVVEDDHILRGVLEAILGDAGYLTDGAEDGAEALTAMKSGHFDLVLTDGNMPRLDGCGLVRALRANGNRIPVMMLSGTLLGGKLPADIRNEVIVALPKPAMTHDLLAGVRHALGSTPPSQTD
jgi:two-component system OmpR family response regulator